MKTTIFILFILLLGGHVEAEESSGQPLKSVSYSTIKNYFGCQSDVECNRLVRSIQRDVMKSCRPHPDYVDQLDKYFPWLQKQRLAVKGQVFFADIIAGQYGYDMYSRNGRLVIHSRVHFKNADRISPGGLSYIKNNFSKAARIWEQNNPFSFPIKFIFEMTSDPKKAHVKNISFKNKTNGPYFSRWNVNWRPLTLAHEFGHVLGLDDEYSYLINSALKISSVKHICEKSSLMCQIRQHQSEIKPYHYYIILRRLFCRA